ncbi:hypothetical protein A3C18_03725 [Candidatus Kaiserbacteria bacterium RIFCSPHIGHO2_02_FULL_54_11b]|uniref:Transposase IS200-like domain-containing protein n=2 Tax=Candidatus Kaiseribacteriota TaxID=1752734 RepID=A0A1F6CQD5_9BACT|nr:MAG: hypothetical protein A2704_02840 [Candidatus Kaiserbacteria bacterium RIFCSPHIGHO2_01_FULL_54_36b]OGG64248.1 MAG: hypothetical protein A3C18_03725 [Candidatus Kaiserbacteria bacterium RIFCSPHIGHO2_02_FULL_54_11b]
MELYHCLNRGVDKRIIFTDNRDRARFVHDMYEFNDVRPALNVGRSSMSDIVSQSLLERRRIVQIHGWCVMGNHYHLLLSELQDGGISLFLRKLNVGYARYFNDRHRRVGTLFQGRTKKILINSDAHFLHILHYIHLNPLDFLKGYERWRDFRIKNSRTALGYLEQYRWSSYLDYCRKKNFPSIITTELFGDVFKNYPKTIGSYLKDIELAPMRPYLLE